MKPEFAKYLHPDAILLLEGESKKNVLEEIITYATTRCTMNESQLREAIWKREKMMTTGVGNGLALPHIRVQDFPSPLVIVGICKNEISDYKSLDGKPVRLIVFLAADEKDQDTYLKILGSMSGKLKNQGVVDSILAAGDNKDQVFGILTAE